MAPRHITLIGFMATGKSEVARLAAAKLGWQAVSGDAMLAERYGAAPDALIAQRGEAAFRRLEAQLYAELVSRDATVVAAGGGAPVLAETRQALAEAGLVVCLEATPETIVLRIESQKDGDARPLIGAAAQPEGTPSDPAEHERLLARTRRLKAQRAALYALADCTITTDALTPDEVAEEVVRFYRQHGERAFNRPGRIEQLTATPAIVPPVIDAPGYTTIVRTASGEYPAYVGWGALERLGEHVMRATGARRAFIVSDEHVLARWGEVATGSLRAAGLETASIALPAGDGSKSIEQASRVYDWLASLRAERRDVIVALGGGVAGDFAGFVAGTYLRGMPYVQAPTSLLAMVDASIGGKTAVNHAGAKNIVGLFNQPRAVVADVATLATLPRRALVEGLGEVIKHALIRDADLLRLLEERLDGLLALEPELTTRVVARNIQIKGDVVSEDERETGGVRELLNYGHTLGHAFEAAGGYEALLHGEAVSAGMMAAAMIGARLGITPPALVERQRALLQRAGLPLRPPPDLDRERIRRALAMDKKIVSGTQRWVLLQDVARPIVTAGVPGGVVEAVLDEMLA